MSFIDKFLAKICAKKIGEDDFGNEYYISCFRNYLGKYKRLVIYNGLDLSSKVPPMWHALTKRSLRGKEILSLI